MVDGCGGVDGSYFDALKMHCSFGALVVQFVSCCVHRTVSGNDRFAAATAGWLLAAIGG